MNSFSWMYLAFFNSTILDSIGLPAKLFFNFEFFITNFCKSVSSSPDISVKLVSSGWGSVPYTPDPDSFYFQFFYWLFADSEFFAPLPAVPYCFSILRNSADWNLLCLFYLACSCCTFSGFQLWYVGTYFCGSLICKLLIFVKSVFLVWWMMSFYFFLAVMLPRVILVLLFFIIGALVLISTTDFVFLPKVLVAGESSVLLRFLLLYLFEAIFE